MKMYKMAFWIVAAIIMFSLVGDFAKTMISQNHNDHMYIGVSALIAHDKIPYKEFTFTQTPYLPLLYGNLYKLLGISSHYLLIGRLISFLFLNISAWTLFRLARRVTGNLFQSLCIGSLFLLNPTIVNPATEVSNYILPVALSFLGFDLFVRSIDGGKIRAFRMALSGALLAIAIGTKLTYVAVVFPFIAAIFLCPLMNGRTEHSRGAGIVRAMVPFAIGVFIGLLPLMFYYLAAPDSFVYNNWGYHMVNAQWRQMTGYAMPMSHISKLAYAGRMLFGFDNLLVISGVLLGFALSLRGNKGAKQWSTGVVLAFLLLGAAVPTALAPTPSFPQYYAVPVSALFLLLVYSSAQPAVKSAYWQSVALSILVLVAMAYRGPELLAATLRLRYRDNWSGFRIHDVSMKIRDALMGGHFNSKGKVATLSTMYAVEANLPIYDELSSGPFFYRSGDLLTPEQRRRFVITSPGTIRDLLAEDPPSAIIVGNEGRLDEPLLEYAQDNNYREIQIDGLGGRCFLAGE